ncbi:MAG: hypothetical protein PVH45_02625 [Candidatus Omnitrophota bacterium]|jgi:hypothetical protein
MGEHKIRDEIDLELSRTYFGNAGERRPSEEQKKKEEEEKSKAPPFPVRRRWSPVVILLILWVISAIIFFTGYFLRGKRIVLNVQINVEPSPASEEATPAAEKEPSIPETLKAKFKETKRKILSRIEETSPANRITTSMPGTKDALLEKIKQTSSSSKITASLAAFDLKPIAARSAPESARSRAAGADARPKLPGANLKTLYDFETDEGGWEIPAWELEKTDHVARSLERTDDIAANGAGSLKLDVEFPGGGWTAALIEVQQYLDLADYDTIRADIYVPPSCPEGLRCKLILTVGESWKFIEMSRSARLVPGEWTTIRASIADGSNDWRRVIVDEHFKSDIRKIAIRIESNRKPVYSGPVYIDNIRVTSGE